MRIGIPNLLPAVGYLFFGAMSIFMTIGLVSTADKETTGAIIFFVIFIAMCYGMLGLLSYRFKIVIMTSKKLIVIVPFRMQYKSFEFDNIKNLKWDLWETYRMGNYRRLYISTSSGYRTNISDLEFINFNRLEKWLIDRTDLELNFDRKLNIELQQAKYNRWLNLVTIILSGVFLFVISGRHDENIISIGVRILTVIVICRLLVRLVQYQIRINTSRQRRK